MAESDVIIVGHSFTIYFPVLYHARFPVVAMGVLKWVDWTVSEPRYFQLQTDHTPVHLALLDEVCSGPCVVVNRLSSCETGSLEIHHFIG